MSERAQAPRFHAGLKQVEGRSILTWARNEWDAIDEQSEETVQVNVTETPMARSADDACVIACTAEKYGPSDRRVVIYRDDPRDGTTPVNKDVYRVWRGDTLRKREDFMTIVLACNTSVNSNLNTYLDENVFLVKEEPGTDHWLSELPNSVKMIIQND